MLVDYVSDLHVNHWVKWQVDQFEWEYLTRKWVKKLLANKKGEVLVIAGDFSERNCQSVWVLDECSKHYNKVYFTYGNHDLYLISNKLKKKYKDSLGRIEDLVKRVSYLNNVVPLIKTTDEYKGKVFAGDVLWYLPDREGWDHYMNNSNDSDCIRLNGYTIKEQIRKMWKDSYDWYNTLENNNIDLFISHVPPVHVPYSRYEANTCYMTNVPFLVSNKWICGHAHNQNVFEKAGTTFYMNCIGYPNEFQNSNRTFELKTINI